MNTLLSIDPSIRNLGWALFPIRDHSTSLIPPQDWGLIHPIEFEDRPLKWVANSTSVVDQVRQIIRKHLPLKVLIEFPSVWSNSAKSQIASNSGSLGKLFFLCGSLWQCCIQLGVPHTELVPVNTWKGQVPKSITRMRVIRDYGQEYTELNHNIIDAIGIGRWWFKNKLVSVLN
jgi:hypothetical protein